VSAPVVFIWSTIGLWPPGKPSEGCRLCSASLRPHEAAERICDACLRVFQWRGAA
jgi:hypothetical protein